MSEDAQSRRDSIAPPAKQGPAPDGGERGSEQLRPLTPAEYRAALLSTVKKLS